MLLSLPPAPCFVLPTIAAGFQPANSSPFNFLPLMGAPVEWSRSSGSSGENSKANANRTGRGKVAANSAAAGEGGVAPETREEVEEAWRRSFLAYTQVRVFGLHPEMKQQQERRGGGSGGTGGTKKPGGGKTAATKQQPAV